MAIAMKKTAAIAIAAGLTFAGSAGIAAQDALAQEPAPAPSSRVAPPAPNMPAKVDFVVNKRVNPAALGKAGTGNASDEAKGDPVEGAKFTLTPITVKDGDRELNIKDQADFNIMAKMKLVDGKPTVKGATATLGKATDAIATDKQGQAKFEGMAAGAYLVQETEAAPVDKDVNGAYIKSAPFIVFLPMTNEDGSAWLNEVHAFPKNSYLELDKEVVDANQNTAPGKGHEGEEAGKIKYTVKATVPSDLPGRQRDQFGVVDIFDNRELEFADQNNPVDHVTVNGEKIESSDYTVSRLSGEVAKKYAPDEVGAKNVNDGYYISFTKPWELPAGGKVVVTFKDAEMKNGADDKVDNTVRLINNYRKVEDNSTPDTPPTTTTPNTPPPTTPPETPPEDPVPHVTVSTYKAKISIFKYSELNSEDGYQKDKDKPLADAEFSLYRCDAQSQLLDKDLKVADDQENAHVVRKGKTDSEGNLVFEGLHVTSYEDDAEIPMEIDKGYCLKETKAPRGYIANPDVQRIKLNHTDIKDTEGNKEFEFVAKPYQIANKPDTNTPPFLPATGGMGVLIIALAGLAIIGGGVYAARRNSQSA
ncbi:SpaH/EbpB family LPXTG-anchored major pilin [Corynebacterium coyleae]